MDIMIKGLPEITEPIDITVLPGGIWKIYSKRAKSNCSMTIPFGNVDGSGKWEKYRNIAVITDDLYMDNIRDLHIS